MQILAPVSRVMSRTRAAWPSCHPSWATFSAQHRRGVLISQMPTSNRERSSHGLVYTPLDKNKLESHLLCQTKLRNSHTAVNKKRKKKKNQKKKREAVMTKYLLACMRTFRTITPSVAIHHVRPLRAAVTLPRLSTRRQAEEFSP